MRCKKRAQGVGADGDCQETAIYIGTRTVVVFPFLGCILMEVRHVGRGDGARDGRIYFEMVEFHRESEKWGAGGFDHWCVEFSFVIRGGLRTCDIDGKRLTFGLEKRGHCCVKRSFPVRRACS